LLDIEKTLVKMRIMKLNVEKIKKEANRLGLSAEDIARGLGMTRQGWYDHLNRPEEKTLFTIKKIAEFFNIDPKDLIIS